MTISTSTFSQAQRGLIVTVAATVSILLGACGQAAAAQSTAPQAGGRIVIAAATATAGATTASPTEKPTAAATAIPTVRPIATVAAAATEKPTATAAATAIEKPTATAAAAATATPQTEIELSGVIGGLGNRTLTIDGKTVSIANAEVHGALALGATVKLHAVAAADGSLAARKVEVLAAPAQAAPPTAADDGATHNANDDHGTDDGATHDANDDHGTDDGATHDANDDHGTDDGATHDANDDHGGSSQGGDDHSGSGGGHGDDHGGHGGDDHK